MTSYEQIKDSFFSMIEKDEDFFNYYNIPLKEAEELAEQRADQYMEEAVRLIVTKCQPSADFSKRTEDGTGFELTFNQSEGLLVPSIMYEFYLFRDFSKLKTYREHFTASEIKVFDPSNARTTFLKIYNEVHMMNEQLLDEYRNTDRDTGKYKTIDVSRYDTEESTI